jgi:hypothetical protein
MAFDVPDYHARKHDLVSRLIVVGLSGTARDRGF